MPVTFVGWRDIKVPSASQFNMLRALAVNERLSESDFSRVLGKGISYIVLDRLRKLGLVERFGDDSDSPEYAITDLGRKVLDVLNTLEQIYEDDVLDRNPEDYDYEGA